MEKAWTMIVEHFQSRGWTSLDAQSASSQNACRTACFGFIQNKQSREAIQEPLLCTDLA
jgi:hypothetical protein